MGEFSRNFRAAKWLKSRRMGTYILPANIDMFSGKSTSTTLFGGIYVGWKEGLYQVSKMSHAFCYGKGRYGMAHLRPTKFVNLRNFGKLFHYLQWLQWYLQYSPIAPQCDPHIFRGKLHEDGRHGISQPVRGPMDSPWEMLSLVGFSCFFFISLGSAVCFFYKCNHGYI